MRPPRRGFLSGPFQEHLSNSPHIRGADGSPSIHSAGVSVFYLLPGLRQEPARKPLCRSVWKWPRVVRAIGTVSSLFSAPPSKAPTFCPWVLPGAVSPEVAAAPPSPRARLSPLGMDAHLHFLQHLEELRRLKDTKRGEKGGVSARRSAEKTASRTV